MARMNNSNNTRADDRLLGVNEIAGRWSCSRSTAVRILDEQGIAAVFLTRAKRGIRRHRLADILRVEASSGT